MPSESVRGPPRKSYSRKIGRLTAKLQNLILCSDRLATLPLGLTSLPEPFAGLLASSQENGANLQQSIARFTHNTIHSLARFKIADFSFDERNRRRDDG